MINPYCEALNGFFSEMVYYGFLKVEDAQCFRTDVKVEPTFYLLFVAAILLAVINSFIMKAVKQYFRDIESSTLQIVHDDTVANFDDFVDTRDFNHYELSEEGKIHPVPVLFTDQYRWFLHREDACSSSDQFSDFRSEKQSSFARSLSSENMEVRTVENVYVETENKHVGYDEQSFDDASLYTHTK
jgi:hypothetical protein